MFLICTVYLAYISTLLEICNCRFFPTTGKVFFCFRHCFNSLNSQILIFVNTSNTHENLVLEVIRVLFYLLYDHNHNQLSKIFCIVNSVWFVVFNTKSQNRKNTNAAFGLIRDAAPYNLRQRPIKTKLE